MEERNQHGWHALGPNKSTIVGDICMAEIKRCSGIGAWLRLSQKIPCKSIPPNFPANMLQMVIKKRRRRKVRHLLHLTPENDCSGTMKSPDLEAIPTKTGSKVLTEGMLRRIFMANMESQERTK
jgi:hypothetical protein